MKKHRQTIERLRFNFSPKLVTVQSNNGGLGIFTYPSTKNDSTSQSSNQSQVIFNTSWSSNSISWYNSYNFNSAMFQLNESNTTYYYVGFF